MARTAVAKQKPIDTENSENATDILRSATENTADIHHMIRTIAATNNPDQLPVGAVTGDQANAHVRIWLEQGFKVHTVMPIQPGDVNGIFTIQVLYVLTKD